MASFNQARKGSGWTKFKGEDGWENKTESKTTILKVIGSEQRGYYLVKDTESKRKGFKTHPINLSSKSTKSEVIIFAKNYMRKHPRG